MSVMLAEKLDGAPGGSADLRLWLRLLSATTAIEKRVRRRLIERHQTTLPRFDVLAALDRNRDGLTMGALSRMLLVSNGNVTSIVKVLLADGLVKSEAAPGDGRVSLVTLTSRGLSEFATMADAHHGWIDTMFAEMGTRLSTALDVLQDWAGGPLPRVLSILSLEMQWQEASNHLHSLNLILK